MPVTVRVCGVTTSAGRKTTVLPLLIAPGTVWLGTICTPNVLFDESSAIKAISCVPETMVALNVPETPATLVPAPYKPTTFILAVPGMIDASTMPVAVPVDGGVGGH